MKAKDLIDTLEQTAQKKPVIKTRSAGIVEMVDEEKLESLEEEQKEQQIYTPSIDPALETIREIVRTLKDTTDIDTSTDFKRNQVILFQQVELLAEHFHIPILSAFCLGIKKKNISIDRGSRNELLRAIERVQPVGGMDIGMGEENQGFPFSMGKNMKG